MTDRKPIGNPDPNLVTLMNI